MFSFLKRKFCKHSNLQLISRFPEKGTTGRGRVYFNYYCPDCQTYYSQRLGNKLFKVSGPNDYGFKVWS